MSIIIIRAERGNRSQENQNKAFKNKSLLKKTISIGFEKNNNLTHFHYMRHPFFPVYCFLTQSDPFIYYSSKSFIFFEGFFLSFLRTPTSLQQPRNFSSFLPLNARTLAFNELYGHLVITARIYIKGKIREEKNDRISTLSTKK